MNSLLWQDFFITLMVTVRHIYYYIYYYWDIYILLRDLWSLWHHLSYLRRIMKLKWLKKTHMSGGSGQSHLFNEVKVIVYIFILNIMVQWFIVTNIEVRIIEKKKLIFQVAQDSLTNLYLYVSFISYGTIICCDK